MRWCVSPPSPTPVSKTLFFTIIVSLSLESPVIFKGGSHHRRGAVVGPRPKQPDRDLDGPVSPRSRLQGLVEYLREWLGAGRRHFLPHGCQFLALLVQDFKLFLRVL